MRRWSVVHISMYAWHICFYPSIIAASAVSANVNYSMGHRNNVHGQEGQEQRYDNKKTRNQSEYFRFSLSLLIVGRLFP